MANFIFLTGLSGERELKARWQDALTQGAFADTDMPTTHVNTAPAHASYESVDKNAEEPPYDARRRLTIATDLSEHKPLIMPAVMQILSDAATRHTTTHGETTASARKLCRAMIGFVRGLRLDMFDQSINEPLDDAEANIDADQPGMVETNDDDSQDVRKTKQEFNYKRAVKYHRESRAAWWDNLEGATEMFFYYRAVPRDADGEVQRGSQEDRMLLEAILIYVDLLDDQTSRNMLEAFEDGGGHLDRILDDQFGYLRR